MNLKEKLLLATGRNLLVYDTAAPAGCLTDRLVDLLTFAMLDNPMTNEKDRENTNRKGGILHTIWIDNKWLAHSAKSSRTFRFREAINIQVPTELDMTDIYLGDCGGSLIKDDKFVGLGIGTAVLDDGTTQEEYMVISI